MSEKLINLDNLTYYDSKIKEYIAEQIATGGVRYLGVVDSLTELNELVADYGDYARVGTAFAFNSDTAHIGDLFINETSGWALIHCHTDTDTNTKYTLSKSGNTITLKPNDGSAPSSVTDEGGELEELMSLGGTDKKTLVIGQGTAADAADYSIVGGTNDKTVIANIIGSSASVNVSINAPTIDVDCGISYGSGTEVKSTGSNAIGVWNTAGVKGYYWSDIIFNSNGTATITLSTEQSYASEVSATDWEIGDTISIVNKSKYPSCAVITAVNDGTITVDALPFTTIESVSLKTPDDNSIFACYKKQEIKYTVPIVGTVLAENYRWYPRSGIVELGWAGTVFGVENLVTGIGGFSAGWNNWQAGDFGVTIGRDNIGGYAALVGGWSNIGLGEASTVSGRGMIVTGKHGVGFGRGTNVPNDKFEITIGEADPINIRTATNDAILAYWKTGAASTKFALVKGKNGFGTGENCLVLRDYGRAGGYQSVANGLVAIADGWLAYAEGDAAVSIGYNTKASAKYANAIGANTQATARSTHAWGEGSKATVDYATAGGYKAEANALVATSIGWETIANGQGQTAIGKYNVADDTSYFIVGNGTSASARKNGFVVTKGGSLLGGNAHSMTIDASIQGSILVGGAHTVGIETFTNDDSTTTTVKNSWNAIFGYGHETKIDYDTSSKKTTGYNADGVLVAGQGNIAHRYCQTVVGKFNVEDTNAMFVVGNGTSNTNRKNLFTVNSNGTATVNAAPVEDMDVVNLAYLRDHLLNKAW